MARFADGDAETDRQGIGKFNGGGSEAAPDPVFDAVDLGGFGEDDGELVARQATDDVGVPARPPECLRHQAQGPIAFAVAVPVVDALEVVEVGEERR